MGRRFLLFMAIAAAGCAVDLATKTWAFRMLGPPPGAAGAPLDAGRVDWIWPEHFGLQTSLNEGALFGMGQDKTFIFAGMSIFALGMIVGWLFLLGGARDKSMTILLGAASAGIAGNLFDRLGLHGLLWADPSRAGETVHAVRDWILIRLGEGLTWPNFNIADSLLVCSVAVLFLLSWRKGNSNPEQSAPVD